MKPQRILAILVLIVFTVTLSGCQTIPEEHKGAAIGAGVGAVSGALIGGSSTRGAIFGGLIGALVGGAIGHYAYDQRHTREETAQTYDYQPTQGTILSVEKAEATPQKVHGGDVVDLLITYAVLTPTPDSTVNITERREITHNGQPVGNPEVRVDRTGGTYTSTVPLRLPEDADKGLYDVRITIETASAKDTRETSFEVL